MRKEQKRSSATLLAYTHQAVPPFVSCFLVWTRKLREENEEQTNSSQEFNHKQKNELVLLFILCGFG
jgi:hypothetical protein